MEDRYEEDCKLPENQRTFPKRDSMQDVRKLLRYISIDGDLVFRGKTKNGFTWVYWFDKGSPYAALLEYDEEWWTSTFRLHT